jgi:hypothetical protein
MALTAQQLAQKVRKVLEINRDKSLIDNTYINPIFLKDIDKKVPELQEHGFYFTVDEESVPEGHAFSASIRHYLGSSLDLGKIVLDGRDRIIKKALVTVTDLMEFLQITE